MLVYLTNDLMFSSRVGSAAQAAGVEVRVVGSVAGLRELLESGTNVQLVLLDLSLPGLDPTATLPEIRAAVSGVTVIAYGPHVHEKKLTAAATAGCDQVLSRGQFSSSVAQLIRRYAHPT